MHLFRVLLMPVDGCDVLQICDLHKGLMKVVKL